MKKSTSKALALILTLMMVISVFAGCAKQGAEGPQGEQGIQGEKGDTGAQGEKGEKGDTGAQGEKGEKGDKGDKGDAGADGVNGKDGVNGVDGKDGADGQTPYIKDGNWWIGETDTGVRAEVTVNGNVISGAKGDKGDTGAAGKDGAKGEDGADGLTPYIKDGNWWIGDKDTGVKAEGTDGKDGADGTNGKDGADGEKGEKGEKGDTGAAGKDGAKGEDGADGLTPYIKDGNWWIGDTDTGIKAEGTDGKDGANGTNGKDGADGEKGEKGDTGVAGKDGRGIKKMWLDADLHLWVEYDDGSDPVDLGYVGVNQTTPTPTPEVTKYTVKFVDHDGSTLKTETVNSGESATAPADPTRDGYVFKGWDKKFDNVTDNLTVTATYTKITAPTVIIDKVSAQRGDKVEVTFNLVNSPNMYALGLTLSFDDTALELVSATSGAAMASFNYTKPSRFKSGAYFMWFANDPTVANGMVLKLEFKVNDTTTNGNYPITMTCDSDFSYDVNDNSIVLNFVDGNIEVID